MALRATLGADFGQFSEALKNVEVQLKTTADYAKNAGRDLTKMVEGFSGSQLFRQAELTSEAVARIGGASKLTEAEARKVNAAVTEAIAKYRALGQEAPAHLQRLAAETKQVGSATESWTAGVGKMAAGYLAGMATFATVQRVIGGTVDFVKESVQAAAEAEAAQKRLETAMRTIGVATEGNRQAFAALAAEMQRTTVYEDDQIVALEAMATQLGVLPEHMEGAIKASANLASGLGIDLEQAMKMVVKANNESFTAFQKLGISIDENRAKAEGLPYIYERINAAMGGQSAAEVETYAGQVKQLGNEWGALKEKLGDGVIYLGTAGGSIKEATSLLRGMNTVVGDLGANWGKLLWISRGGPASIVQGFIDLGKQSKTLKEIEENLDKVGKAALDASSRGLKPLKLSLDDIKKIEDDLAKDAKKQWEDRGRAAQKAGDDFRKLQADIYEIEKVGAGATNEIWKFGQVLDEAGDTAEAVKNFEAVRAKLYEIEKVGAGASLEVWKFGQVIDEAGESAKVAADQQKAHEEKVKAAAKAWATTANVLNEVSRAAEMAGHKTTAAVMSIGAAVAQAAPGGPWGMALAGGMALFSTLSNKLFKTEGRKVNDLRDAYISAAGGLADLNSEAAAAGKNLNALLRADTVREYEAAIADLNAALAKTAATQKELAGLQQSLADRQVMDWQRAQELIEKYGGTLGMLGQQFTAAKQAANWKSIWDDWQTLIDMGGDVGGVLFTMKDELSALVQESLRVGTEIPEQFRPLIEELIRTGQLLGENGEAITDLGQLKFGAPLVSEVDKIIKKIDELIAALTSGLTGALNDVGRMRPEVTIHAKYEVDDFPDVSPDVPGYARGTGGFVDFGAGTLAMLHGYEAVVPRGQAAPSSSGAAASPGGRADRDAAPVNVAITIHAMDPIGLKQVVEKDVVPLLVSAYRRNVNGARTETRKELVE